jgi:hypothetical protein
VAWAETVFMDMRKNKAVAFRRFFSVNFLILRFYFFDLYKAVSPEIVPIIPRMRAKFGWG